MKNGKNLFQTRRWPALAVAVVALLYTITNWQCVLSPTIQAIGTRGASSTFGIGIGTFLSWGLILPVLLLLSSWFFLFKQRHRYLRWIVGIIVTVVYVSMGCFTIFIFSILLASGI